MTTPATDMNAIADTLRDAMLAHFAAEDFDVHVDLNNLTVTVSTDDWTLFLNPIEKANCWIAVDDEPIQQDGFQTAMQRTLGLPGWSALSVANERLDRLISDALGRSGDRFSKAAGDHLSHIAERIPE